MLGHTLTSKVPSLVYNLCVLFDKNRIYFNKKKWMKIKMNFSFETLKYFYENYVKLCVLCSNLSFNSVVRYLIILFTQALHWLIYKCIKSVQLIFIETRLSGRFAPIGHFLIQLVAQSISISSLINNKTKFGNLQFFS